MTTYTDHGYKNRADYLECMAADYGVDIDIVLALAMTYGSSEDFDGLIIALEDMENMV